MENIPHKNAKRLAWIEACLRFAGRFGVAEKKAYADRFSLTEGMVSRDQDAFLSAMAHKGLSGDVVKENGRLRLAAGASFPDEPLFPLFPKMADWLQEMLGPKFESAPSLLRNEPSPEILKEVLRAIEAMRPLRFEYQPRSGDLSDRIVSPHVIVDAAGRLHLRGWDHTRNAPRDFVLTRIMHILQMSNKPGYVSQDYDHDWRDQAQLEVRARDGENIAALRADYGLDISGRRVMTIRKAHAYYMEQDETLDQSPVLVRLRKE